MRTTLAIADDVLAAARTIAEQQSREIGDVITDMARYGLQRAPVIENRNGIPVIVPRPGTQSVTLEIVNSLRDDEQ